MFTRSILVLLSATLIIFSTLTFAQSNKENSTYNIKPNLDVTLATPPTVVTNPATIASALSAVLNGTVNPQGKLTAAQFQWGTTLSYGNVTTLTNVGSGNTNVPFTALLTGLTPNTQYHFRITATNSDGTSNGVDKSFTTPSAPTPTVYVRPPSDIDLTSATFQGEVNPNGYNTTAWFTWGKDSLLNVTSPVNIGSDTLFHPYTTVVNNLQPNTTYQYFANALNVGGASTSFNTMMFTTLASSNEYLPDGYTVGLYHLNDAKEFIQDYSGQENNGTVDTLSGSTSPEIIPGKYGYARDFTRLTQQIEIISNASLEFTDESFTLEAWVNPEFYGGGEVLIIGHGSPLDSSLAFQFKINPFYQLEVNLSSDGTFQSQTSTISYPLQANTWQHVAAIIDLVNFEVRIFHNGLLQPTTSVGSFPTSLYISPAPVTVGTFSGIGKTSTGVLHCSIDEIRISNIARQPSEFKIPGSVSGIKFWDRVNLGYYDETSGDTVLGNWGIILQQLPTNSDITNTFKAETTYTNEFGFFSFTDLDEGIYQLSEVQQISWLQTYPAGNGKYQLTISGGTSHTNINFGNASGYKFSGPPGGSWNDPGNWEGGDIPGNDTPVYFDSVEIVYDVPFDDSIGALRIGPGGRLTFNTLSKSKLNSGGGSLYIEGKLQIDEEAILDGGSGNTWLYCDGDFENQGNFQAGNSTIVFTGTDNKTIIYNPPANSFSLKKSPEVKAITGNTFFNLTITGTNTSTNGNVVVNNQLDLVESLSLGEDDTLSLENPNAGSLSGSGLIPTGTLRRKVTQNNQYRFESDDSFIQFDETGAPEYISVTPQPDAHPDSTTLRWKKVDAIQNTTTNTFTVSGLDHFSKWVLGKPGTGYRKGTASNPDYVVPKASRTYTVLAEGGSSFNATLQLRYEDGDIYDGQNEEDLELAYGAFYVDSVRGRWNMLSLPVLPDDTQKDSVFRNSTSDAFRFDNFAGYTSSQSLSFGTGYWLKYPQTEEISILGNDQTSNVVNLEEGWNMIGTISYPIDPSAIYYYNNENDKEYFTSSSFFGYDNGYELATVLEPMRAYWVKSSSALEIVLDMNEPTPSPKSSVDEILKQSNSISFSDASGSKQSLYFTYKKNLNSSRFELPPIAPQGIFDARFASGNMLEDLTNQSSKLLPVTLSSTTTPLTISWNITNKSGNATLLVDGKEIPLWTNGKITVTNPAVSVALKLNTTPSPEFPQSFALYQNYPNPFNPTTTISFDLPKDELVTLKIFNILGQEIVTAINNSEFKAGHHSLSFNTTDWSSGVYFYKLTAGSFSDMKKMILAR
ncbi:MAG: T9SS type A sorting domain-containing protein [Ignavibacteriae bacterium]|nr:T9SS type A sorting domain-containing protein [Ignavibacteriota bacterium]